MANAAGQVGEAMARAQPVWLAAAVVLHVAGQVCRGLAWHGVLRASWPGVPRGRVCAWHVCGAGLTGVLPARGGDAVRVLLARREMPETPIAALVGSLVAEGALAAAFGMVLVVVACIAGVGSVADPSVSLLLAAAVGVTGLSLLAWRSGRVRRIVRDVGCGAAILRDPRRFARWVLPWQLGNRALRLGSVWCLLHAVGLPAGLAVVLAACAALSSGNAVPLPGANAATATAALLVALPLAAGQPVEVAAVVALAVAAPTILTLVGLTISFVLACALLGTWNPRGLVRAARALWVAPPRPELLPPR